MEKLSEKYLKGFNAGYIITSDLESISLLDFIQKSNSQSDFIKGLKDGRRKASEDLLKASLKRVVKRDEQPNEK